MIEFENNSNEDLVLRREHKGKSFLDCINDYIVVDIETTGLDSTYDEIIEIGAVKVKGGIVDSSYQTLVKPTVSVNGFISEFTGITDEMLSTAPKIDAVIPDFLEFVGQSIIIGHNIVAFDGNFLYDACIQVKPFRNDFIDTLRLSRKLYPNERHNRLRDLRKRFKIKETVEHRAIADSMLTYACYEYMKNYIKDNNIDITKHNSHKKLRSADITSSVTAFDDTTLVFDNLFVFTGKLDKMIRQKAMQLVVDMGGRCGDTITKETNYLVLGNNDYVKSIKDGKSIKQKKAEEYKAKGYDIEIISENIFYEMVYEI